MRDALTSAAASGDLKTVKKLLAAGADPNAEVGVSALMKAVAAGNAQIVERLLEAGARVNATDPAGWTALMYAAQFSKSDDLVIVDLLVNAGADVNAHSTGGTFPALAGLTALDLARQKERPAIEARLEKEGARLGHAPALQPRGRRLSVICMRCRNMDHVYSSPASVCPKCGGRWLVTADADALEQRERQDRSRLEWKIRVGIVMIGIIVIIVVNGRSCGT